MPSDFASVLGAGDASRLAILERKDAHELVAEIALLVLMGLALECC